MRVLMISGDEDVLKAGTPAYLRTALMRAQVDALEVVYMGRGSAWPKIPQGSFDVVTSQDPFWRGLFAWRAAKRLRAKLNVQVHSDLSAQSLVKHMLAQIVLRHADSVRAVSANIQAQVGKMGVRAPISVLPIFVDIERFKTVQRQPHEGKSILWVGRFEKEKDPFYALEVFKEVRRTMPDTKLTMLGKGSLDAALRAQARGLPIEFPGWQDAREYLSRADVALSTSPQESWGASIVRPWRQGCRSWRRTSASRRRRGRLSRRGGSLLRRSKGRFGRENGER
jgi:glycosyltransferase involved in cell wall biosynthesis